MIILASFLWLWFQSVCPLMEKDERPMEASWWERLRRKLGLVLMGGAMLSKYLIQFSAEWVELSSLPAIYLGPNYGGGNEDNGDLLRKFPWMHCSTQCPQPCSRPLLTYASSVDSWHSQASLGQSLVGSLLLFPGSWCRIAQWIITWIIINVVGYLFIF